MTRGWWLIVYALSSRRFQRHVLVFLAFWFVIGLIIVEIQEWSEWIN